MEDTETKEIEYWIWLSKQAASVDVDSFAGICFRWAPPNVTIIASPFHSFNRITGKISFFERHWSPQIANLNTQTEQTQHKQTKQQLFSMWCWMLWLCNRTVVAKKRERFELTQYRFVRSFGRIANKAHKRCNVANTFLFLLQFNISKSINLIALRLPYSQPSLFDWIIMEINSSPNEFLMTKCFLLFVWFVCCCVCLFVCSFCFLPTICILLPFAHSIASWNLFGCN